VTNCTEPRLLVQAYLDHELDVSASLEMEEHFRECTVCAEEYEAGRSVRAALAADDLYRPAPEMLARRIRSTVGRDATSDRWHWRSIAAPLAVAALIALMIIPGIRGRSTDPTDDVIAGHVRSLMVDHLTDVASTDKHTVKPWFEGKLDFSPAVVDLADHGFPLVGGRLDYLGGHPVAALVYGRQRHFVNVFVYPDSGTEGRERSLSRQGFQVIHWNQLGMSYWAVSDLNAADLGELVALIRERIAPPA
jgi:anti-sigma factor RsiW